MLAWRLSSWGNVTTSDSAASNVSTADDEELVSSGLILSMGYVTCAGLFLYPGLLNLEENITMQIFSFATLLVLTAAFLVVFMHEGLETTRVAALGDDWKDCIGVIIFNFAFCVTIPSWINEKEPGVEVNTVIWSSTAAAAVMYAAVGWLGGLAFESAPDSMLELLASPAQPSAVRLASAAFGVISFVFLFL